jgi:biopolymer transport protein TolR
VTAGRQGRLPLGSPVWLPSLLVGGFRLADEQCVDGDDMKPLITEQMPTIARINVTPIIDVALVLVIILLITAPMIAASNLEVDLPEARTRSIEDEVRLSVTLGKDGQIAVDEDLVERNAFGDVLRRRIGAAKSDNVLVVVRADAGTSYTLVYDILGDVRSAGAGRIAIATRQRGKVK